MNISLPEKLRSNRGASVSIALLLFLICSVVGALVITAASAAAGRTAKLASSDQRYYSVASAMELLTEELSETPVVLVRSKTVVTTDTTVYTLSSSTDSNGLVNQSSSSSSSSSETTSYSTSIGSTVISSQNSSIDYDSMSLLSSSAARLLFADNNCNNEAAMSYSFADGFSGYSKSINLAHSSSATGVTADDLEVSGTIELQSSGDMVITLQNVPGSDKFSLTATLTPTVTESVRNTQEEDPSVTQTGSGYTETNVTTAMTEKISIISWTVSNIR